MNNIKELSTLTSSKEELDWILDQDCIFVLTPHHEDDNNCPHPGDLDLIEDFWKLRGDDCNQAKLANSANTYNFFCGWVISIKDENVNSFEKAAWFETIKTGYSFKKIDVLSIKRAELEEKRQREESHFNSFFEVM